MIEHQRLWLEPRGVGAHSQARNASRRQTMPARAHSRLVAVITEEVE